MVQNLSCSISKELYIIWLSSMGDSRYTFEKCTHLKNDIISGPFFIFSKVWFSQFSGGWKDKKCPKMTKKSVWHALKFQETCIYFMWSSFMVHMCKRIISPGIFFNFWKFSFSGSLGGEGVKGKKWPKMTKELCLPHTISQELYIISLWFLVHMFKMMISPAIFFFFKIF